jgi:hypothetical protein
MLQLFKQEEHAMTLVIWHSKLEMNISKIIALIDVVPRQNCCLISVSYCQVWFHEEERYNYNASSPPATQDIYRNATRQYVLP